MRNKIDRYYLKEINFVLWANNVECMMRWDRTREGRSFWLGVAQDGPTKKSRRIVRRLKAAARKLGYSHV